MDTIIDNFSLVAGSASFFLPALAVGAAALISSLANVVPRAYVEVQWFFDIGKLKVSKQELQQRLVESDDALVW